MAGAARRQLQSYVIDFLEREGCGHQARQLEARWGVGRGPGELPGACGCARGPAKGVRGPKDSRSAPDGAPDCGGHVRRSPPPPSCLAAVRTANGLLLDWWAQFWRKEGLRQEAAQQSREEGGSGHEQQVGASAVWRCGWGKRTAQTHLRSALGPALCWVHRASTHGTAGRPLRGPILLRRAGGAWLAPPRGP